MYREREGNICGMRDVCLDTDQLLANTDLRLDMYQLSVTFLPDGDESWRHVRPGGGHTDDDDPLTVGMSYTNKHSHSHL